MIVWSETYNGRPVVRVRNLATNGDAFDALVGQGFWTYPIGIFSQPTSSLPSVPAEFVVGTIHVLAGDDGGKIDRFNIFDDGGRLRLTRIALPGDRIEYATDALLDDDGE